MSDLIPSIPYLSYGKLFIEPLDPFDRPVGGMRQLGWYEAPSIKNTRKSLTIPNNELKGGGDAYSNSKIDKSEFSITMYDFISENLALFLNATYEEKIVEVLTDFERLCFKGRLNTLDGIIDVSQPIVVKHDTTTFLLDTDYYVSSGGIIVPNSSPIAALDTGAGVTLKISASLKACTKFEVSSVSDQYFALRLETYNEATNDTDEIYDYYKLRLSGADEIQPTAHNDKMASVKLSGSFMPVQWRVKKKGDSAWGVFYRAKD